MNEQEPDFVDEIVPSRLPEHIAPPRDDFKPWHKVRKQFIRTYQWNRFVVRVAKRYLRTQLQQDAVDWSLEASEASEDAEVSEDVHQAEIERSLKCLLIPGDDLLDLRSLWQETRPLGYRMRYLGFNESQGSDQRGTRVHVANNEVTSLSGVATDSRVIPDKFQAIASERSQAYRYLKEYGPFHVVNLDICDSLFPTQTSEVESYYSSIHRLAEYQMKSQTSPWLLFITTQVEPGQADESQLGKMCEPIKHNMETHPDFATRFGAVVPTVAFQPKDAGVDITQFDEDQMILVFGVALGKWLMGLAATASPNWLVQMMPSYRYAIRKAPRVDMLSLAFLFRPKFVPPVDRAGLSTLTVNVPKFPDELETALKLITTVQNISDVDQLLREDLDMRADLEAASADLLESAGFDRAKYLQWSERYHE